MVPEPTLALKTGFFMKTSQNNTNITKNVEIKNVYTSRFQFLIRSGTTQEGSQGLWDYPQPTLDASRVTESYLTKKAI